MTPSELHHSESYKIIIVNIITLVVAIFAVLLRLVSRWLSAASFWWDDGLIIIGLVLTFGSSAFNFVAADNGAGKHQAIVPPPQQATSTQIIYGIEILYGPLVTAIKCSILTLYLRLFGVRPAFRRTIYAMLALVAAWCVAVFFAAIFQASPPRLLWTTNLKDLPPGAHHIDFEAYLIGTAVPNVVMDFAILLLPMGIVWQLQISKRRKMALSGVFAVGAFVCAASIVRAHAVATVSFTDRTYAYASTLIWSAVEVNVGITCACLPVLQPVLHTLFGKVLGSDHSDSSSSRRALRAGAVKSTKDSDGGAVVGGGGAGGPFRRLDEDVLNVRQHPPRSSAWVAKGTPEEREVQMNTIRVKRDVDLERGVEVV
ncbi:hypothetical protein IMSHALPRED_000713 [Imshaugia aleurites]|uniref:Rhodopsin domain-containing protein n=1 Tax=Imshaugia aleurites TaxID=172621 RepID=A0A8H3IS21_9LECA|nr:hypothetical protein IMSHALPRED_000713 [Imshaugia aleurites]